MIINEKQDVLDNDFIQSILISESKDLEHYDQQLEDFIMSDFLHKMLQSSMDREARKLASNGGVTEQDRYGNLLNGQEICVRLLGMLRIGNRIE